MGEGREEGAAHTMTRWPRLSMVCSVVSFRAPCEWSNSKPWKEEVSACHRASFSLKSHPGNCPGPSRQKSP